MIIAENHTDLFKELRNMTDHPIFKSLYSCDKSSHNFVLTTEGKLVSTSDQELFNLNRQLKVVTTIYIVYEKIEGESYDCFKNRLIKIIQEKAVEEVDKYYKDIIDENNRANKCRNDLNDKEIFEKIKGYQFEIDKDTFLSEAAERYIFSDESLNHFNYIIKCSNLSQRIYLKILDFVLEKKFKKYDQALLLLIPRIIKLPTYFLDELFNSKTFSEEDITKYGPIAISRSTEFIKGSYVFVDILNKQEETNLKYADDILLEFYEDDSFYMLNSDLFDNIYKLSENLKGRQVRSNDKILLMSLFKTMNLMFGKYDDRRINFDFK